MSQVQQEIGGSPREALAVHDTSLPMDVLGQGKRCGDVGIFAGDWAWYETSGGRRQPVGFAGILLDTWDGWVVFGCVRDVAEAIVAEHRRELRDERAKLRSLGYGGSDLEARFAGSTIGMWFDGDDIVIDERGFRADPDAITWLSPDERGLYVIRGYIWPWISVEPDDCDHVVESSESWRGAIADFGDEQLKVAL